MARMGDRRGAYRVLVGNLRENESFEDPGVGEKIILKWICRKWDGGHRLNRAGSG